MQAKHQVIDDDCVDQGLEGIIFLESARTVDESVMPGESIFVANECLKCLQGLMNQGTSDIKILIVTVGQVRKPEN